MRFYFFLMLFIHPLYAYNISSGPSSYAPDVLEAGPEIFFLRRIRKGGSRQEGRQDGVFINYEFLKKNTFYFGGSWQKSRGKIDGASGRGTPLLSTITDENFEGRIGYTLQHCSATHTFFTPLVGYGLFQEENAYSFPSPVPIIYVNSYQYFTTGFLTGADMCEYLGFWISFRVRYMINGTAEVSNDPIKEDTTLKMNNELAFRLDCPLILSLPGIGFFLKFAIAPFYEFRHYGGRVGYPYNYYDTKMNAIGGRASVMLRF